MGTWEHMAVGIKMVLANGIAGMTFAGCECHLSLPFLDAGLIIVHRTYS